MTYSLGGKQYIEVAAGNSLFVFALNELKVWGSF